MEGELARYLILYLLEEHFHSEAEMAEQLGISPQELADAGAGQCDPKAAARITGQILRYCIRQKIPLDALSRSNALSHPSP